MNKYYLFFSLILLSTELFSNIVESAMVIEENVEVGIKTDVISVPKPVDHLKSENPKNTIDKDEMLFFGEDRIQGEFLAYKDSKSFHWKHFDVKDSIVFSSKNIQTVKCSKYKTLSDKNNISKIYLTNGDQIIGKIVSMNEDILQIETWYAGVLKINRPMIKNIFPNSNKKDTVYSGFSPEDDWMQSAGRTNKWKKTSKGYISKGNSGYLSRNVDLPDNSRIDIDLSWKNQIYMTIYLYNDSHSRGNAYSIEISGDYVNFNYHSRNSSRNRVDQHYISNFYRRGKAKLTLLTNKSERKVMLLLDGNLVKSYKDSMNKEFMGKGRNLTFYNPNSYPVLIKSLKVQEWDGQMPNVKSMGGKASKNDVIFLANKDKISGSVLKIAEGTILLKSEFANLSVPMDRVIKLQLSSDNKALARRNADDIKATFSHGGKITIDVEKIIDGMIFGKSENFGLIECKLEAFKQLDFNLYDDRWLEKEKDEESF